MHQTVGDPAWTILGLLLLQSVDQFHGREEAHPFLMMLDSLDADRCGDMRLARAWATYQNDVVGLLEEFATIKLAHQGLVDLAAGKVEAVQVPIGWKACRLELIGSRSDLPLGGLCFEELRQDRNSSFEGW